MEKDDDLDGDDENDEDASGDSEAESPAKPARTQRARATTPASASPNRPVRRRAPMHFISSDDVNDDAGEDKDEDAEDESMDDENDAYDDDNDDDDYDSGDNHRPRRRKARTPAKTFARARAPVAAAKVRWPYTAVSGARRARIIHVRLMPLVIRFSHGCARHGASWELPRRPSNCKPCTINAHVFLKSTITTIRRQPFRADVARIAGSSWPGPSCPPPAVTGSLRAALRRRPPCTPPAASMLVALRECAE